jgi:hypothetical protein
MALENSTPYAVQYLNPTTGKNDYIDLRTGQPIPPELISQYQHTTQEDIDSGKTKLDPGDKHAYQEIFQRTSGGDHASGNFSGSTAGPREPGNNYGYASKPGFLGVASAMPGPVGIVGKVANVAMNVNNGLAVNKARESLGFAPKSMLGAAISDNKGLVGEVTNGVESTPVSIGAAQTPDGRTAYTPNEARMRSLVNPGTMAESDRATVNAQKQEFQAANPDAQKNMPASNMFSKMAANLFHPEPAETPAAVANPVGVSTTPDDTAEQGDIDTQGSSTISAQNRSLDGMGLTGSWGQQANVSSNGTDGSINSNMNNDALSGSAQHMVGVMDHMGLGNLGVNSDRRSVTSNAAAGGAKASQHLQGNAVDVATKGMTNEQKEATLDGALAGGATGIGMYGTGSMHIDTRNQATNPGGLTMWGSNPNNHYAGQTVDQSPAWAQSDLQAKIDSNGYGYLSSHMVPTPTARPTDTGFMGASAISSGWGVTGGIAPTNSMSPSGSFASAGPQTSGPTQSSTTSSAPSSGPSTSSSSSSTGGMGMGGRSDNSAGNSGSGLGGGFSSAPGNKSDSDSNGGQGGYGGSRSDGWN